MPNPSITWPDWMDDEIDKRKHEGEPMAHYVRKAIQARFEAEDAGEWESPDIEPPAEV